MIVALAHDDLMPAAWRPAANGQPVHVFNPGLAPHGEGWLLAYRVVCGPELQRRIALCRLDARLQVIGGSAVAFTDQIRFPTTASYAAPQATRWFADPRLYRFGGEYYLYWNSGWHEPQNHQFLQRFDPVALTPVGPPRELVLAGNRQKLEKNWALFESGNGVYGVYSVNPHRVLRVDLSPGDAIRCEDLGPPTANDGGYARVHGGLRGGAPPLRLGEHFYSFCHSIENDPAGFCYVAGVYRFSASAPFAPTDMPRTPLPISVPPGYRRRLPKLNPAVGNVFYPAGAVFHEGNWLISAGIDDEQCAIAIVPHGEVLATLEPRARGTEQ